MLMISVEQLNLIRIEKKVSKTAISKHLGLSRQQVSNILSGNSSMKVQQLIEICELLQIDTAFIYK